MPWKRLVENWRKQRVESGTTEQKRKAGRERRIFDLLNRTTPLDALDALMRAYRPEPLAIRLAETAIVLDSSAFLRLGSFDDVVDYLDTHHAGPLILPGQSIQEFWNNNLNVADSIATGIGKRFEALKQETEKVDSAFHDYAGRFSALLAEFRLSFGYAYDGITVRRTHALFEALHRRAITCYTSREPFSALASHRKRTKTPPGFKDDGDGDFFVWLDLLQGVLIAKERDHTFSRVALVTHDKKLDWSREGIAHPVLNAEMQALAGVPFETWDITKLVREVASYSDSD